MARSTERQSLPRSQQHVPETLVGREAETEKLLRVLSALNRQRNAQHVWMHGPPGTGKTSVALAALAEAERKFGIRGVYINCWESPTFYGAIARIVREFRILHTDRVSTVHKLEVFEKHLAGKPLAIVLDEIDKPTPKERDSLIYNLCNMPKVALICICNSNNFYRELDERVKSRLKPLMFTFKAYSQEALKEILQSAAVFQAGRPTDEFIEEVIHASGGDLRVASTMLHQWSGRDAKNQIAASDHLKLAAESAGMERTEHVLAKLTDHHRIIHAIVHDRGEVQAPELRRRYGEKCRFSALVPVSNRTFNHYLQRMKELGIMQDSRIAGQRGTLRVFRVR